MAIGMAEEEVERGTSKPTNEEELCIRTSWVDARTALSHINKGRATGSRGALWVRKILQDQLYQLGEFSEIHSGKILFVALLIMATFCVGLKSAKLITDIEQLWVEEGGRLERELNYVTQTLGENSGTTSQILIQANQEGKTDNILTPESLSNHLKVLLSATKVTVELFDISWSLNDLCFAPSFPYFEYYVIEQAFEKLSPCAIITPLDCFWEGSKLLGPEYAVKIPGYGSMVKWTNLDPQKIVEKMKQVDIAGNFPFSVFTDFMKRSGITTAYQQKPCLNPSDPECPQSAPNKNSLKPPDIGAELTGGCYGFAGKYLHWPEELIVGGTKKNRTRHIVRGEALQSIVQLMGSKDLYIHWQDHYKVHDADWSQEKAALILEAWVAKFSQRVKEMTSELGSEEEDLPYTLQPFASSTLTKLIREFSAVSVPKVAVGCVLLILYTCFVLLRLSGEDARQSSVGLGVAGVILVIGAVTSGLGLCALLGLPFSAATTQILPFFTLGLGVNDMFVIVSTVQEITGVSHYGQLNQKGPKVSRVGEILKRCGVSVAVTSFCSAAGFFAAAVIPVPALRVLCLQAGLIVLSTLAAMLLVFPALVSLDLRRRDKGRADFLCCLPLSLIGRAGEGPSSGCDAPGSGFCSSSSSGQSDVKRTAVTRVLSPPGRGTVTRVLCGPSSPEECWVGAGGGPSLQGLGPSVESLAMESTGELMKGTRSGACEALTQWSLKAWFSQVYASAISRGNAKAVTVLCLFLTVGVAAWGVARLEDGLDLTDIVPGGTPEGEFLRAQQKYFGFYNMFAVTQGNFEYPTKQKLLQEYHEAFNRVPWIIKNDDGGLPDSWLVLFRDWLLGLQKAFDSDWSKGYITEEGWTKRASDSGVLAYKLLVQTGHVDHPVDKNLVSQVRLVDAEGIINPKAFYNYLTAWASNDVLAYSVSQASLVPVPRIWYHERNDYDLKIPKSSPIVYAQFPFYLNDLDNTEDITTMIEDVRSICKKFEDKGLPNFPTGIPFTFWEQYINLRFFLLLGLVTVLGTVFLVLSLILVNIWAAALVVLILATLVLQVAGILGLVGLRLSAAPGVLLVIAVGVGVEFSVHVTISFLTAIGSRDRRVRLALGHMASPVMHGAASTLLSSSMLLFSDFDFVSRYFFVIIAALVLLGSIHGLLFLPVILSLVGPPAQLVSRTSSDRLPLPTPPPSPQQPISHSSSMGCAGSSSRRSNHAHHHHHHSHQPSQQYHHNPRRPYGSNLSLTTISEEPASNASTSSSQHQQQQRSSNHEILVEPQVVVETTTFNGPHRSSDPTTEGVVYHEGAHVTTTVTATAKVKVELHNKPLSGLSSDGVHRSTVVQSSSGKCTNSRCSSNNSSPTHSSPSSSSDSGSHKNS